jgi:hypothetical protein
MSRKFAGMALAGGLGVIVTAGCSRPPLEPVQVERQEWTESGRDGVQLLSEHFDLRLTTRDEVLRDYLPTFLETAFAEYAQLMPPARNRDERLVVYLFETRPEWERFTRTFAPAQAHTYLHIHSGGYTDYATATAVAFDLGRDRSLSLLAHEGMHQYLARYFPVPVPSWLNEGLACQFEAFDIHRGRPVFTPRKNLFRLQALRDALGAGGGLIPPGDLLRMDAGEAVRQTIASPRVFYAQLWSMIYYLRQPGTPYSAGFRNLLADAGTPRLGIAVKGYRAATSDSDGLSDAEVVFRHYVTADLEAFMADYRAFAEQLAY